MHVLIYRTSENCKSLLQQDKCNIEIFLSPDRIFRFQGHKNFEVNNNSMPDEDEIYLENNDILMRQRHSGH